MITNRKFMDINLKKYESFYRSSCQICAKKIHISLNFWPEIFDFFKIFIQIYATNFRVLLLKKIKKSVTDFRSYLKFYLFLYCIDKKWYK